VPKSSGRGCRQVGFRPRRSNRIYLALTVFRVFQVVGTRPGAALRLACACFATIISTVDHTTRNQTSRDDGPFAGASDGTIPFGSAMRTHKIRIYFEQSTSKIIGVDVRMFLSANLMLRFPSGGQLGKSHNNAAQHCAQIPPAA
jgi:hypothetical protein